MRNTDHRSEDLSTSSTQTVDSHADDKIRRLCAKVVQTPPRLANLMRSFTGHHVVLVVCCAVVIGAFMLELQTDRFRLFGVDWPLRCALYSTFGVKCTLCGITRSFWAIAHGDIVGSVSFHALGPAIFAYLCVQIPYRIYALVIAPRKTNRRMSKIGVFLGVLLLVAMFANWLIYLGGLVV